MNCSCRAISFQQLGKTKTNFGHGYSMLQIQAVYTYCKISSECDNLVPRLIMLAKDGNNLQLLLTG